MGTNETLRLEPGRQYRRETAGGVRVHLSVEALEYGAAMDSLADELDASPGVLLRSGFEYPGRYTRWDIGFVNPPLRLTGRGRELTIEALNRRGEILLAEVERAFAGCGFAQSIKRGRSTPGSTAAAKPRGRDADSAAADGDAGASAGAGFSSLVIGILPPDPNFSEEQRSRQHSVFSALRAVVTWFRCAEDPFLGLYGAFGYDLTFQFEDIERHQRREAGGRDLVLYLPDRILVADHRLEQARAFNYDFICREPGREIHGETTGGFKRAGPVVPFLPAIRVSRECDHEAGEYAAGVKRAKAYFRRGDLFEVVPGQTFFAPCKDSPAKVFKRLAETNPAPYGALMNLGEREYLVAASPEMFVRVEGDRIETCPISGTIARGGDALSDAEQVRRLLNSKKDESELSMCTDVDRNDKARVCEPGTVEVVGRRQIEVYSRLIHTVDHVKGRLKAGFDALDGFLSHTWAVTVTGAPKRAAMQYLERHEKSPRRWYGGAIGHIGFDGNLNTGLTLRTIRIQDGVAEVRAGATLLADSNPEAEEQETRLKARALMQALGVSVKPIGEGVPSAPAVEKSLEKGDRPAFKALRVLMVDHEDSFVHSLGDCFRRLGAELLTLRPAAARECLQNEPVDLLVLSPGPATPQRYDMAATIEAALGRKVPIFGVCLGLQGIVEYFGGELGQLPEPMHGKQSVIAHCGGEIFAGLPGEFAAGRYHSLVAAKVPECLAVTARSEDGEVMAVEHRELPVRAVQFHPESIMSLGGGHGPSLIRNVLELTVGAESSGAAHESVRAKRA